MKKCIGLRVWVQSQKCQQHLPRGKHSEPAPQICSNHMHRRRREENTTVFTELVLGEQISGWFLLSSAYFSVSFPEPLKKKITKLKEGYSASPELPWALWCEFVQSFLIALTNSTRQNSIHIFLICFLHDEFFCLLSELLCSCFLYGIYKLLPFVYIGTTSVYVLFPLWSKSA